MTNQTLAIFPINFVFLLDNSGSMNGSKISQLNVAMDRLVPKMRTISANNSAFPIKLGAIYFNSDVGWHIHPTEINNIWWNPLQTTGTTNMAEAINLASTMLKENMGGLGIPPIVVLLSDGHPDGGTRDDSPFCKALDNFCSTPWGKWAKRRSIAVGSDCDRNVMKKFAEGRSSYVIEVDDAASQLPKEIEELALAVLSETLEYNIAVPSK